MVMKHGGVMVSVGAGAAWLGLPATHKAIDDLRKLPNYREIKAVFDATLTGARVGSDGQQEGHRPRARGVRPFTIPVIGGDRHHRRGNVNIMVAGAFHGREHAVPRRSCNASAAPVATRQFAKMTAL